MGSDAVGYFVHSEVDIGYDSVEAVQNGTIACAGSGQEWMPLEVNTETLTNNSEALSASGRYVQGEKLRGGSEFTYYKGYRATDERGNEYITTGDPQNGLLRVEMAGTRSLDRRKITVSYHGTKIQRFGYLLTMIGFLIGSGRFLQKATAPLRER